MLRFCSVFVFICWPLIASADVVGRIAVLDGDTIRVGDTKVRLHGVDAPELDQQCDTPSQTGFACGVWVKEQLAAKFGQRRATCTAIDKDKYGRVVAKCHVSGQDIGAWLVSNGLAFAYRRYSLDYDLDEKAAFALERGLHKFAIQGPEAFRKAKSTRQASAPSVSGCVIKGNISSSGRIYHVPGQEFYEKTSIRTDKGERWFCSEAEAKNAGWRRARR